MNLVSADNAYFDSLKKIHVDADKIAIVETTIGYRQKLLELIKGAQKRIYLTALYLQDDAAGQEVLHAIYQAKQANPNLDVKIFVDFGRAQRGLMGQPQSIGNVRLYRECAAKYEHSIDILGVPVKSREVLGVLHLKGFIFDHVLFYSGASINDIYLQQATRYRYDRYHLIEDKTITNSMVKFLQDCVVTSPAVKDLSAEKIETKKQLKPAIKKFKKALKLGEYLFEPSLTAQADNQVSVTPLLGFGGRNNPLNKTIIELIKSTENKITIYTPYFNLPNKVNKAVKRLLKNGKAVDIIVGDKKANDFYIPPDKPCGWVGVVPYVYETNLRRFIKNNQDFVEQGLLNVRLWLDADNSFHLKGISVDLTNHLITGHNINPRAWSLDLENGLLIQDRHQLLKQKFESEHKKILEHTQRIEHFTQIETLKDYPEEVQKRLRLVRTTRAASISNRLL